MNAHPGLEKHLQWLFNHSLQAGLLVLLVLLVQWILRSRLTSRWRFALWWIVLARLLMPFSPESALSLFNVVQPGVRLAAPPQPAPILRAAPAGEIPAQFPPPAAAPHVPIGIQVNPLGSAPAPGRTPMPPRPPGFEDTVVPTLACLWLAGVLGLSGVVLVQWIRFHRKLERSCAPSDPNLQGLLDECRREFGLSRRVLLLETDAVQSPALFGLLRLRLLLPRGIHGQFSGRQLRYIFLHELAHVKRGDLWLNWLVSALQLIHWFNPLLWLGFARLRADRELACDELALLCAGDKAGTAYAETVVKLLEHLSRSPAVPGLVGILEDKKQMLRRISMIASFHRPGRWSVLAVLLIAAMAAAALTDAQSKQPAGRPIAVSPDTGSAKPAPRPGLNGRVSAKGGAPLPVPATVLIATAAPKSGSSTFCPSCYADCVKHARTDADGRFSIESLDPQLTFQLLAVAKGYQPEYVSNVDPAKGTPVNVELEPIESSNAAPDRSLRGRVVDSKGAPVESAVVEMQGIETRDGGGNWGMLPGVDPLAVTDEKGEFLITSKKPFELMTVKVTARRFADKIAGRLPSGAERHELVMTEGAAVTGRLLSHGKPLGGVSVGVSALDRTAGNYLGHFEVGTGARGAFAFVNLPPDADFLIYSLMGSMKQNGAVSPRKIHTGKDGETTDAGDLVAGPSHRLAGRVVLSDGGPLPSNTRLLISREAAWDVIQPNLDEEGRFDVTGIPSEIISLSVRVRGYHVSGRNLSLDVLNPYQLTGRVDQDTTNLVFMLEKGPETQPDYSQVDPDYGQARSLPLRGIEGVPDHSRDWSISGHVLDGDTKQPVRTFRVTPGQAANFNQTLWSQGRAVDGTNGVYLAYVSKRAGQPLLKVDAEGYLPECETLLPGDATNADFVLKKGSGPAGTVVLQNGAPAAGATLVLLGEGYNQASLETAGELTTYRNPSTLRTADASGHFAFKPVWGMNSVAAASSNGFAVVSLKSFATHSTIALEPYGKIIGTLKRASGPGANESLGLMFAGGDAPQINLQQRAATDAEGRFTFDSAPSGHLQIWSRKVLPGNRLAWSSEPLQEVEVKPGQAVEVTIAAPDREPADAALSRKPPQPKFIPGVQVKGVVLSPGGKPAANADVALQVAGTYLALGRAAFVSNDLREEGLLASAGTDGSFALPMCEGSTSVIALNEEGYAQVSLEQLKSSGRITLQRWGRIEGTLRVGHHAAADEQVILDAPQPGWGTIHDTGQQTNDAPTADSRRATLRPPYYDSGAFEARTDGLGRFAITFVPPGQQVIARMVPQSRHSWTHSALAIVEVRPGETTVTHVGGTGRVVTGKLTFADGAAPDFEDGVVTVGPPVSKMIQKLSRMKTDEERKSFYQSEEFHAATKDPRSYFACLQPDGTFRAEDVPPGNYEVSFQPRLPGGNNTAITMFTTPQELTVPAEKNKDDDSAVDWGAIVLNKFSFPMPAVITRER